METSLMIASGVLGLTAYVLWWKNSQKTQALIVLLVAVLGIIFTRGGFEDTSFATQLSALLIGSLSISYVLSRFIKSFFGNLLGLTLSFVPFLYIGKEAMFLDYPLNFGIKDALILPLLGSVFAILLAFKARILSKIFGIQENKAFPIAQVFGLGILFLAAETFGSFYGLILVGFGYLNVQFFQEKQEQTNLTFSFSLFALAIIFFSSKTMEIEFSNVLSGPGMLGLFLGLGSLAWITGFDFGKEPRIIQRISAFAVPVLFFVLFLGIEKVKEFTGGPTALFYILFALSVSVYWVKKQQFNLLISLFLTGFTLLHVTEPYFKPIEMQLPTSSKLNSLNETKSNTKKEDILNRKGEELSGVIGKWKINAKDSKLRFELGQVGKRTKGFFSDLSGDVSFNDDLESSTFSVKIPVKSLSSFNDYRDESLMSAAYFNEAKFPIITFESKRLTTVEDRFFAYGNFTMMGVTKELKIEMKLALKGEEKGKKFAVLVGKSSIDRTQFGQTSDAKIGNIVDFEFEVELNK